MTNIIIMTIGQALKFATTRLNQTKISLPHLEAEILLSSILKKPCEFLLTHPEYKPTVRQISNFQFQISRRLKGEPIAYLIGHKEFYGLDFMVNKNVLIPRPETELMVEETLKLITHNSQLATLIDVGTGSGCIIVTLAKLLSQELGIMNHELWGIDISKEALTVAKQNARHHRVAKKIKFIKGDLLTPLIHNSSFIVHSSSEALAKEGNSLVILANLPYLTPSQIKNSLSIEYEPKLALSAGTDGLKYYKKLFKQLKALRVVRYALCEFDPRQTEMIIKLIKKYLPETQLQIKKDLAGLNRLVIITIAAK